MATVESFRELLKPLILYSKLLGVETWTAPGKLMPASYHMMLQMIIYLVSLAYTVIKYRYEPMHIMKVLVTFGTALQAMDMKELTETIERDILKRYQNGTDEEVAVLNRTGRYLWIIFRIMRMICNGTAAGFAFYPIFVYFTTNAVMPFFLHELPFLDYGTTTGYVVNMLLQMNLIVNGVMGVITTDFVFLMFAMYAMVLADIFILHLDELEAMLNDPLNDDSKRGGIREKWLQCVYDHQQATW
uniref:Odorant receptor n=1 Tax=Anopheles culicifacies TaxID=139723 RepID=A0A182MK42_9DIPT